MNINLLFLGLLFTVFGYFIAVKGQLNLITFIRNREVKDKEKVAKLLGGSQLIAGAAFIAFGLIGFEEDGAIISIMILFILAVSFYVFKKYIRL